MIRKCIYTGKQAKAKDSVIPRAILGDEIHNWAVHAPADHDYLINKSSNMPTELEMQANEIFHLLELHRLRVVYYEKKLEEIQAEIIKNYKEPEKPKLSKSEKKKEKEIEKAVVLKEVVESTEEKIDNLFKNKRKMWDDEE